MKLLRFAALLAALSLTYLAPASAAGWTDDYARAVEKAKTEKKNLLLDFTGSDWCGFCKILDKEVFDSPKFKSWASKNVVLVTVDFPRGKRQTDKLKAQNAELKAKFMKSGGYPTIVIIDPEETVLTQKTGYKPGSGPEAYLETLKSGEVSQSN